MRGRGIALGGFMAVGKTTVGRLLASTLDWPFVDLDDELVRRFGPIADQWLEVGEAAFRSRESAVLREYCDGRRRVLATGGGTWIAEENRRVLAQYHERCVLHASTEALRIRLAPSAKRPLAGRWETLLSERQEAYADADFSVRAEEEPGRVVRTIMDRIRERGLI